MYHIAVTTPEDQCPKSVMSLPQKGKTEKQGKPSYQPNSGSPSRLPLHNQSIGVSTLEKLVQAVNRPLYPWMLY